MLKKKLVEKKKEGLAPLFIYIYIFFQMLNKNPVEKKEGKILLLF